MKATDLELVVNWPAAKPRRKKHDAPVEVAVEQDVNGVAAAASTALTVTRSVPEITKDLMRREEAIEIKLMSIRDSWREIGAELTVIRDQRLYQPHYPSFETYLDKRWNMSRSRGYQLVQAVEIVDLLLSTTVDTPLPATEAAAREYAPIKDDPKAMAKVAHRAGPGAPAKKVRTLVRQTKKIHETLTAIEAARPANPNGAWDPTTTRSRIQVFLAETLQDLPKTKITAEQCEELALVLEEWAGKFREVAQ
jgi:hypothetical protein